MPCQGSCCVPSLLPADLQTALQTKLTVDWRAGVAATDWDTIAKKEHLDQLSVEMRKVEGQIREIYAEMLQLQQREQEMRDLNGELTLLADDGTVGSLDANRGRCVVRGRQRPSHCQGFCYAASAGLRSTVTDLVHG